MIEKITRMLADNNLNIADMINKSKGNLAYNITLIWKAKSIMT